MVKKLKGYVSGFALGPRVAVVKSAMFVSQYVPGLCWAIPLFSVCGGCLFHVTLGLVLGLVKLVRWLLGELLISDVRECQVP